MSVPVSSRQIATGVFEITVRHDELEPEVTILIDKPELDGSYDLRIYADDGNAIGSAVGTVGTGVENLELYLDGELIEEYNQDCPNGGCSMNRTRRMSVLQSTALHEVAVLVDDGAENTALEYKGPTQGPPRTVYERFGYNDNFDGEFEVTKAVEGGASLIRFPLDWCMAEPTEDNWNWNRADRIFGAISARNTNTDSNGIPDPTDDVGAIPVLLGAPPWARDPAGGNCDDQKGLPARALADTEWPEFVAEFLRRYGPGGSQVVNGGIIAIEVWNEPNLAQFWGGGTQAKFKPEPQRFARLVSRAYDAVKAVAPTVQVLPGGLSPVGSNPKTYMEDATDPTIENPDNRIDPEEADAISVHLYANAERTDKEVRIKIREKYDQLVDGLNEDFKAKDRWITEIGFPAAKDEGNGIVRVSEKTQRRRMMVAYFKFGDLERVKAFVVHSLIDAIPAEPARFGVINKDTSTEPPTFTPRRAYCQLAEREGASPPGCS